MEPQEYENVVTSWPAYGKMIRSIGELAKGKVLEVGVGTGLLTEEILKHCEDFVGIDIDETFLRVARERFPRKKLFYADGTVYRGPKVDTVVMGLTYHHIPDDKKQEFIFNVYWNLRDGGRIVIGDVFLKEYSTAKQRDKALRVFHGHRLKATKNKFVRKIEGQALADGLARNGEYKVCYSVLGRQLRKAGFRNIRTQDIGPQEFGGYRIVVASR